MRKTIDEIKIELSITPQEKSFRLISKEEQQYYWGAQLPSSSFLSEGMKPLPQSKILLKKKKLSKLSSFLFPTSFPNN